MGDIERVGGYFRNAGVELPSENLLSCDTSSIGKPDPAAYKPLLERLSSQGGTPWFAAAHMWDVSVSSSLSTSVSAVANRLPLNRRRRGLVLEGLIAPSGKAKVKLSLSFSARWMSYLILYLKWPTRLWRLNEARFRESIAILRYEQTDC